MAASNHIENRSEKKSFLDIVTLIRSIQRAEGNTDCFQMGMIDCDQVDCKWRSFRLVVFSLCRIRGLNLLRQNPLAVKLIAISL
jgi:hypothetical protein